MGKTLFYEQFFERGLTAVVEKMGQSGVTHVEITRRLMQSGFALKMGIYETQKPLIAEISGVGDQLF